MWVKPPSKFCVWKVFDVVRTAFESKNARASASSNEIQHEEKI